MKKLLRGMISILCACSLLMCSGCSEEKTKIAYSVYPIGYLLQAIGGSTLTYESIQDNTVIQRATVAADYQEILEESSVFFHIGSLEPYYTVYRSDITESGVSVVDLGAASAVYDFNRYIKTETEDGTTEYDEYPYYDDSSFSDVNVNTKDLTVWMDPIMMISMARTIADQLSQLYPDNQELYEENLDKVIDLLTTLETKYRDLSVPLLQNGETIRFAAMTTGFGNWQKSYGFEVYPIVLSKYGVLPSQDQLEVIKERLIEDEVQYIVYEENMTDDMKELFDTLQQELNLTAVTLSSLSSLTDLQQSEGKDYLSVMYENLDVLSSMTPQTAIVAAEDDSTD